MKNFILGLFLIIIIATFTSNISGKSFSRKYGYTGVKVCRECHGEDAIGNQYKIWAASPHAKGYLVLTGKKAEDIAALKGFAEPAKNKKCLKCHTTGGGESASVSGEGVGCEACHGPGEKYHTAGNHVDYSSRENGYRRAIKLGMKPILGITSLSRREKLCLSCHTDSRPCYEYDLKDPYKYKIPIQVIDSLMKGDVNLRHPLRR